MVIYKIYNTVNDKVYIGQTVNEAKRRFAAHVSNVKHNRYKTVLYNAMKKYGIDCFQYEVINKAENIKQLNELEVKYIAEYNSIYPNGYNLKIGGDNHKLNKRTKRLISESYKISYVKENHPNYGKPLKQETKDRIGAANNGKKRSLEARDKMSKAKIGKPSHRKGALLTKETKEKIAASKKGTIACNRVKVCADNIIYDSISLCAHAYGKSSAWVHKKLKSGQFRRL